jgi:hypothetical protein
MGGRIGQIFPRLMKSRHDQLVREMLRRGMNHNSPYEQPDVEYLPEEMLIRKPDYRYNFNDLHNRCPDCRKIFEEFAKNCLLSRK